MVLLRMAVIALRLAGGHLLTPWRSPLLRWRAATYGVTGPGGRLLHAEEIGPAAFLRFLVQRRGAWWRFLRWAAGLPRA